MSVYYSIRLVRRLWLRGKIVLTSHETKPVGHVNIGIILKFIGNLLQTCQSQTPSLEYIS